MNLWVTKARTEVYSEASAPGIWKLRSGDGYFVRARGRSAVIRGGATLDDALVTHQQLRTGRTPRETPTFETFAQSLLQERIDRKDITSPATIELWQSTLRNRLIPAFGERRVHILTHLDVVDWVKVVAKDDSVKASTKNKWLDILRTITAVATVRFDLRRDPCEGVENFATEPIYTFDEPNSLLPELVKEFLARAKVLYPELYPLFLLGFVTGRRPGELRAIDRNKDVHWEANQIVIRRSHSRGREIQNRTKTQTEIVLGLPKSVMEILKAHVTGKPGSLLFPDAEGNVLPRGALLKPFETIRNELQLSFKLTPRAMRRSFQDLARAAEVSDLVTRSISGHKTVAMQEHYSTVGTSEKQTALEKVMGVDHVSTTLAEERLAELLSEVHDLVNYWQTYGDDDPNGVLIRIEDVARAYKDLPARPAPPRRNGAQRSLVDPTVTREQIAEAMKQGEEEARRMFREPTHEDLMAPACGPSRGPRSLEAQRSDASAIVAWLRTLTEPQDPLRLADEIERIDRGRPDPPRCLDCASGLTRQEREEFQHLRKRNRDMHDRAQRAEVELSGARAIMLQAFLSAVNLEHPCPFCLARTDNVWPYCAHFHVCPMKEQEDAIRDMLDVEAEQRRPAAKEGT